MPPDSGIYLFTAVYLGARPLPELQFAHNLWKQKTKQSSVHGGAQREVWRCFLCFASTVKLNSILFGVCHQFGKRCRRRSRCLTVPCCADRARVSAEYCVPGGLCVETSTQRSENRSALDNGSFYMNSITQTARSASPTSARMLRLSPSV